MAFEQLPGLDKIYEQEVGYRGGLGGGPREGWQKVGASTNGGESKWRGLRLLRGDVLSFPIRDMARGRVMGSGGGLWARVRAEVLNVTQNG